MKSSKGNYQPVIIIGAARSGTRLLRDLIAQHPDVDKVPYDINFAWRFGNENLVHDEIPVDRLTPQIKNRIVKYINHFHTAAPILIEKTVGNCLRIPFVSAVFPQAKYIHLVRHGEDVIESVYRQWNTPADWGYIFRKVQTYPIFDAPTYALKYFKDTLVRRIRKNEKPPPTWGPVYDGIHQDLLALNLWEICALQWVKSIKKALNDLASIDPQNILTVRYEDFVKSPASNLETIAGFLKISHNIYHHPEVTSTVTPVNIGKAKNNWSNNQQTLINPIIAEAMQLCKYTSYFP